MTRGLVASLTAKLSTMQRIMRRSRARGSKSTVAVESNLFPYDAEALAERVQELLKLRNEQVWLLRQARYASADVSGRLTWLFAFVAGYGDQEASCPAGEEK